MLPSLLTLKFYKNIRKNITHNVANFLFCTYPTNTIGQQKLQVVCFVSLVKSWTTRAQFRRPPDSQLKPKTVCHTLLTASCTHNNRCQPRTWYEYVYVLPRNRAAHGDCVRMIRAPATLEVGYTNPRVRDGLWVKLGSRFYLFWFIGLEAERYDCRHFFPGEWSCGDVLLIYNWISNELLIEFNCTFRNHHVYYRMLQQS